MNKINFETNRVDSVTQIDESKKLSDEVIKLRNKFIRERKDR